MIGTDKPIVIDLFCGAGGLSLGFRQAGFNVIAGFDFDPIHVATHKRNFPDSASVCADIRALTAQRVRFLAGVESTVSIDAVVGGPPCQGFSVIGKRDMRDERNQLLGEFCRLVIDLRPRYFVLENVAGLMYGEARVILAGTLRTLRNGGYRWVTPIRILDAADFGVPQRRKRVFILGYRGDQRKPEYPRSNTRKIFVNEAIRDLKAIGQCKSLFTSDIYSGKLGVPSEYARKLRKKGNNSGLSGCLRAVHDRGVIARFRDTEPGTVEPISHFARLKGTLVAPTLRAGTAREYGGFTAARPIHHTQPRCITVREAARLHSFPDWFEFHPTQWHGFRQVGNSVPPMLARVVGSKVYSAWRDMRRLR